VNSIDMGNRNAAYGTAGLATNNVGGTGILNVNSSWQLGNFLAADVSTNGNCAAVLNIGTVSPGGTVNVYGNITTTRDPADTTSVAEIHVVNTGSLLPERNGWAAEYPGAQRRQPDA